MWVICYSNRLYVEPSVLKWGLVFWLLLRILACPVAEPCFACGGHREKCILYFFMCTLIFMYMPPDILVLTVVVLLDFFRTKYN